MSLVLVHIVDHITIHYGRGGGSNDKKSLKIPKVYSGYVNRRRTDNTMAKKKYKKTNNDLQNIHIQLKIE